VSRSPGGAGNDAGYARARHQRGPEGRGGLALGAPRDGSRGDGGDTDSFVQFRRRVYFLLVVVLVTLLVLRHADVLLLFLRQRAGGRGPPRARQVGVSAPPDPFWAGARPGHPARDRGFPGAGTLIGVPFVEQMANLRDSIVKTYADLRANLKTSGLGRRILTEIPPFEEALVRLSRYLYGVFTGLAVMIVNAAIVFFIAIYLARARSCT